MTETTNLYAVIRLRGSINIDKKAKTALSLINLNRTNNCVLLPKNKETEGRLQGVRNFVTYGEISPQMLDRLISKRGRKPGDRKLEKKEIEKAAKLLLEGKPAKEAGLKPVFRLSPASGGLKSIRLAFPKGDLGYRAGKINGLLENMI